MANSARFDPTQITAAILAGGEGRRVDGRDKGLLLVSGRPLVAYAAAPLRDTVSRVIVCANRNRDRYAEYGDVFADDESGFRGPLAGIATALAHCATPWLLTVPVDCPAPPQSVAARLYAAVGNSAVVVAYDGTRRQPLFALYRSGLLESAQAALSANLPVWRWQDDCGAVEADFSDRADAFDNLNSDEEIRAWEQRSHE